jgi:hypothetical protein
LFFSYIHNKDAKRVLDYRKHKLDNVRLNVSLLYSKTKKEKASNKEKQEPISSAISSSEKPTLPLEFVVSGISQFTTEDSLRNYLENTRRSGGGDVQTLMFDKEDGLAEVKLQQVECKYLHVLVH